MGLPDGNCPGSLKIKSIGLRRVSKLKGEVFRLKRKKVMWITKFADCGIFYR
jgi:hypothetical protein